MYRTHPYAECGEFFDEQWPLEETAAVNADAAREPASSFPWLLPLAGLGAWWLWRRLNIALSLRARLARSIPLPIRTRSSSTGC
jgi:hypothetical protein